MPRALWRLFELSGDGLVWLAWTVGMIAAPGTQPATRAVWVNFLAAWALDLALVRCVGGGGGSVPATGAEGRHPGSSAPCCPGCPFCSLFSSWPL